MGRRSPSLVQGCFMSNSLYVKANGELPCWDDVGEDLILRVVDERGLRDGLEAPLFHLPELTAIRAQGPGGQHVNKTSSAMQLRFDIAGSAALSDAQRQRLRSLRDRRVTASGELIIKAQRYRSQDRNREDALRRLAHFVNEGLRTAPPRKATRPGRSAVKRRLDDKSRRSKVKSLRGRIRDD